MRMPGPDPNNKEDVGCAFFSTFLFDQTSCSAAETINDMIENFETGGFQDCELTTPTTSPSTTASSTGTTSVTFTGTTTATFTGSTTPTTTQTTTTSITSTPTTTISSTQTTTPTTTVFVSGFTCLKDFPAFEVANEIDKGDGSTYTQESCDSHTATANEILATCAGDLPYYELDCDDKREFGTNILIKCVATCPPSPVLRA